MKHTTEKIAAAVGCAGVALTAISAYFYKFAILQPKNRQSIWAPGANPQPYPKLREEDREKVARGIRFILDRKPEEITIRSADGLWLCGHFIAHENPVGIFLMVHGYRSHPLNDFSGAAEDIYNMGFSLLLIDLRAHGSSEGRHISFGVLERCDLIRWSHYLNKRFPDLPVVADGVSMGASIVMMAAGLGYPRNVKALICDCGYTSPAEICKSCMKKWFKLPPFPIFHTVNEIIKLCAGFSLEDADTREALPKNRLPILIAHGTADDFVPYAMGEENFAACTASDAELFSVQGAGHGMSYILDPDGYLGKMQVLFRKAGIPFRYPAK